MLPARVLDRIQRLRDRFLDDGRGGRALADYWRDADDLAAYDAVLAPRIGWKWDAALAECRDRGFARADGDTVLDLGCGTGIAARRFAAVFGAHEVLCHDRSPLAMGFAVRQLAAAAPAVKARALASVDAAAPDVLLVSHVLGELDADGEAALLVLARRCRRIVIVEPGTSQVARRLAALRDQLLPAFRVVAPCPHAQRCPTLLAGHQRDWCHFFATPPPEVFTDGDWVRIGRELGIDLRSLPYAFLALDRNDAAAPPAAAAPAANRVLGRPTMLPHRARVQVCRDGTLAEVEVTKCHEAALWKTLKKHASTLRSLPGQLG